MPERPTDPPPERMVRQQPRPDHTVSLFTELVSRESARYQAIANLKRGTIYATTPGAEQHIIDAYPTLYFCREMAPLGSNAVNGMQSSQWVILTWSTDLDAENTYNATVDYLGDAIANPAYTRVSTVRRDVYDASPTVALGSPLTALLAISVTVASSAYTTATVTIGGPGSGATAEAVIGASGEISAIIVTNEGSGYTTAPTITITGNTPALISATAEGIIQSQSAVLTAQRKDELPDTDPLSNEFVRVTRVYEVLPGPLLPYTRWDENLGQVQGSRQAVVWASQLATNTATGRTTYEAREGSSYVAWKITETWSNGTGVGSGNDAYPILITDIYDDERGAVQRTSQIVVKTGSEVGSLTESGGVITRISYEPFNEFLLRKIIETWAAAGPELTRQKIGEPNLIPPKYRSLIRDVETNQLVDKDYSFPAGLTGDEAEIELAQLNIQQARLRILEQIILVGGALDGQQLGEYGTVSVTESIVNEGTAIDTGYLVIASSVDPLGNGKSIKITASVASYPQTAGQNLDRTLNVPIPYTLDVLAKATADAQIGTTGKEITPMDSRRSRVQTIDVSTLTTTLNSLSLVFPGTTDIALPDVLTGISAVMERESGIGDSTENGAAATSGTHGGYSLGITNSSQSSAAIMSELIISIQQPWGRDVPVTNYVFFMAMPLTRAAVLARLATLVGSSVSDWPRFKPTSHRIICKGGRVSLQVVARAQVQYSFSSDDSGITAASSASTSGRSQSKGVGLTVKSIHIPPTIHGAISISGDTFDTESISASAAAAISGTVAASANENESAVVEASVSPASFSATPGQSTIPSSGYYMLNGTASPYQYGMAKVHCVVLNAADLGV